MDEKNDPSSNKDQASSKSEAIAENDKSTLSKGSENDKLALSKDSGNDKSNNETPTMLEKPTGESSAVQRETKPENTDPDSDSEINYFLAAQLVESLNFSSQKILSETSIDGVVKYIKDCPNIQIITMVGAGISTAAGIPDFRSPGTGIYNNLQKYNLPYTNAIFELDYFLSNPEPFYHLAGEIFPGSYKPTKAHYFIKLLEGKKMLLRHYSQNIDNLERLSGISDDKLIEAHGTFHVSHCTNLRCRMEYDFEWLQEKVSQKSIPKCTKCDSVVKPDIVFFGEALPRRFYQHLPDFQKCDLLIIMGSSLAVEPFASLVTMVKKSVPRLMINATNVGFKLGLKFSVPDNGRDVLWIGDCDSGCELLVEKLGWKDEFQSLLKERDTASKK